MLEDINGWFTLQLKAKVGEPLVNSMEMVLVPFLQYDDAIVTII